MILKPGSEEGFQLNISHIYQETKKNATQILLPSSIWQIPYNTSHILSWWFSWCPSSPPKTHRTFRFHVPFSTIAQVSVSPGSLGILYTCWTVRPFYSHGFTHAFNKKHQGSGAGTSRPFSQILKVLKKRGILVGALAGPGYQQKGGYFSNKCKGHGSSTIPIVFQIPS